MNYTALSIMVIFGIATTALWPADRRIAEDEKIWKYLMWQRQNMVCVTKKPFRVEWAGSTLCARPNVIPHTPHGEHWIHVFVNPRGTNVMTTGKGSYPVGTMILKQKFLDAEGRKTDFYTGMHKREEGYNPAAGDWEFFMLDRHARTVIARGKIDSCIECHKRYQATDFVARRYLPGARVNPW